MHVFRRGRFWYWLLRDLAVKYTRSLIFGFIVGFGLSIAFWRLSPTIRAVFFSPVERIGMVGDYSPSRLPSEIQKYVSVGLTTVRPDGSVGLGIAAAWEATDSGKTYVFKLRPDLIWHNGKPVKAADINYNFRTVRFTVIDPLTLKAELESAYSPFPTLVAKPVFTSGLVGVGSYRLGNIKLKGDSVSFLRLIPVDGTNGPIREYRFYRTEAMALLGYKLGEIDTLVDLSSSYGLDSWGQTAVETDINDSRILTLFFNLSHKLLKEKNVRQALGYALPDFKEERAYTPIPKYSWAYTDKVRQFTYDPKQVEKLLGPLKMSSDEGKLTITTFSPFLSVAEAIAGSWTAVGIPSQVRVVNTIPSDFDVLLSAQDVPLDPDQYTLWHSTQKGTNRAGYVNVKIDKLLEDGRQEIDMENRKKLYADFQRRLVDDAPALFLYYPRSYTLVRGNHVSRK